MRRILSSGLKYAFMALGSSFFKRFGSVYNEKQNKTQLTIESTYQ